MVRREVTAPSAVLALLAAAPSSGCAQDSPVDHAEIRQLMRTTWERPDAPLSVEPIVVVEGYAIAGWVQEERGGRALLRRRHEEWDVILCSGDHLRSPETAVAAGVPQDLATRLASRLATAESGLPSALLTKFSLFDGVVRMDGPEHPHGPK